MAKDIEKLSFEEALSELESIVKGLESGSADLQTSIESYTRGSALKKHCEDKLKEARLKVEKITLDKSGKASTEPFSTAE